MIGPTFSVLMKACNLYLSFAEPSELGLGDVGDITGETPAPDGTASATPAPETSAAEAPPTEAAETPAPEEEKSGKSE